MKKITVLLIGVFTILCLSGCGMSKTDFSIFKYVYENQYLVEKFQTENNLNLKSVESSGNESDYEINTVYNDVVSKIYLENTLKKFKITSSLTVSNNKELDLYYWIQTFDDYTKTETQEIIKELKETGKYVDGNFQYSYVETDNGYVISGTLEF